MSAADLEKMCTFKKITALQSQDVCGYVDEYCTSEQMIRFSYFYFCQVNQNIIVLDLLTILVPFIAFRLLGTTSEYYLSPALAKLAKCFKLSQTVAGVTLLALGNGAPDVITAIVAGNSGDDSITIAVGSIFGAGLFVTTFTLANVIMGGGIIKIDPRTFFRDITFYMIGCMVILAYTIVGQITLAMAICFMAIYVVFITIVIYQDRTAKKEEQLEETNNNNNTNSKKIKRVDTMATQRIDEVQLEIQLEQIRNEQMTLEQRQPSIPTNPAILITNEQNNDENNIEAKSFVQDEQQQQEQEGYNTIKRQESQPYQKGEEDSKSKSSSDSKTKDVMTEKYENFKEKFGQMNLYEKIVTIYEIPVDLFRYLTIPPAEDLQWNKYRALICCYTSPIAFLLATGNITAEVDGMDGFYVAYLLLGVSVLLSIIVFFFTKKEEAPCFQWLFSIASFVVAVSLLSVIAQVLIDFINFFQILTSMNKTFLGMTLLALGNSATDFFTNQQLAKMGYGVMALTGCFAGQAFNLYIGFGFGLALFSRQNSGYGLSVFSGTSTTEWFNNGIAIVILVATIVSSFITLNCSVRRKFVFSKGKFTTFLKDYYLVIVAISIALCAADQFYQ